MLHYTINTGHTRESPRAEVGEDVLATLAHMLASGNHVMPGPPGYSCRVTIDGGALLATVSHGQRPCISFGVATDDASADMLWSTLEKHYHEITDMPGIRSADFAVVKRPASTPWCAAITIMATPDEAYWMADFERCLAWAWIEAIY